MTAGRGIELKAPGFFMGYEDGKALRDLIATGHPVKLKMNLKTETRQGLEAVAAYGTLPGTTDENVYVLAQTDGYYDAAMDNASGLAVMETPPNTSRKFLKRSGAGASRLLRVRSSCRIAHYAVHARPSRHNAF